MADHQDVHKSSVFSVVYAVLGGILVPMILIALVAKFFIATPATSSAEEVQAPKAEVAKIEENIKPVAAVEVASNAGPAAEKSGEEVVKAVCSMCHAAGLMESPKLGDKASWAPRIAQGYDTLVKHAIAGIRNMPAKGGNPALSDNEVASTVAYMANEAGANFKAPAPAAAPEPQAAETKPADATVPAVVAEAAPVAATGKSGEEVVKGVCAMCHSTGLMNSPKIGDKAAWQPRIAQGYDTLVQHAVKGVRMMPAKGGNPSLSDDEVARAVVHMANQSGADFKAP